MFCSCLLPTNKINIFLCVFFLFPIKLLVEYKLFENVRSCVTLHHFHLDEFTLKRTRYNQLEPTFSKACLSPPPPPPPIQLDVSAAWGSGCLLLQPTCLLCKTGLGWLTGLFYCALKSNAQLPEKCFYLICEGCRSLSCSTILTLHWLGTFHII